MSEPDPATRNQRYQEEIRQLRIENERLRSFLEIGKLHSVERNLDRLLPLIMTETSRALHADRSTLFVIDLDRMELWTRFAEGLEHKRITIDLKMGIAGLTLFTRKMINVKDAYEELLFNRSIDDLTGYRTQSLLCAPFFDGRGEPAGIIQLINKGKGIFTREDEEVLQGDCGRLTDWARSGALKKDSVCDLVSRLTQTIECQRGSVFLLDRERKKLSHFVTPGMEDHAIELNMNVGVAGYVAITGEELNVMDVDAEPLFDNTIDQRTGYTTKTILCMPVRNHAGEILGVIQVINKKNGIFDDSDRELLRALTHQIAVSLENAILFHEQKRQFESLLEVLAASIDAKDPMTAGHSEKVAEYAAGVARELGFGETEIDILNVAALLHDYGKIGVCDTILKKPGKLTDKEYHHIQKHVEYTRDILSRMSLMRKYRNVPHIASCHHERLDGSGYGSGLKGHEIPVMSKILAVADVFEALTANRHYREALGTEEAFRILDRDVGTKFDEHIVNAMKTYWRKRQAL